MTTTRGKRESAAWFAANGGRVEALWERRARMIGTVEALTEAESGKAWPLMLAIREAERELELMDQAVEPYMPGTPL